MITSPLTPVTLGARLGRWLLIAAGSLALAGACGCAERDGDARPVIVASVLPHQWLVHQLAGDRVRCEVLLPPGASPGTYQPSFDQLRAIEEAVLYVRVGHPAFPFERAWLDSLLGTRADLRIFDASLDSLRSRGSRGSTTAAAAASAPDRPRDPHYWLSPRRMLATADGLAAELRALLAADTSAVADVDARLAGLHERIGTLDRELRTTLGGLEGRPFFVFHPAWGYFAEEYGLEQVAIEYDHKPPGARELVAVIDAAKRAAARVVFVEPQFDASAARTVAREIGARVEKLDPLAYDWDANLRRSAQAIAEALRS